jgi:hypothetical protein
MGKAKEQLIEAYGGYQYGQLDPLRFRAIDALNQKLRAGDVPLDQVDGVMDKLRSLQGIQVGDEPHD